MDDYGKISENYGERSSSNDNNKDGLTNPEHYLEFTDPNAPPPELKITVPEEILEGELKSNVDTTQKGE